MDRRLFDLMREQAIKRGTLRQFGCTEIDEMVAIRKLVAETFGQANVRHDWPGGPYPYHWGGVLEVGPDEPGIIYAGVYLEPPTLNSGTRRRKLFLRGAKHSEFVQQIAAMRKHGIKV